MYMAICTTTKITVTKYHKSYPKTDKAITIDNSINTKIMSNCLTLFIFCNIGSSF